MNYSFSIEIKEKIILILDCFPGASEAQLEQAKSIIETAIISRVYPYALYPNGDVDRCRDQ